MRDTETLTIWSTMDDICKNCEGPTDPSWFCSEGYCPDCCLELDEGSDDGDDMFTVVGSFVYEEED